ncbi:MAG: hypothetical protein IT260_13080 [Saprospiraceae bacterium]|nr:hypothetical protein [Saprospiraceae bacterium]
MKKTTLVLLITGFAGLVQAQNAAKDTYQFSVDLTRCEGDRLQVELIPPRQKSNDLRYCLPKMVPGIYGAMDFGQYVHDFQAFDSKNKPLPVQQENPNVWRIEQGKRVARISYSVDDTWDNLADFKSDFYRSAGSTYNPGEGFVINHNTLFGFFEGQTERPYSVQFRKPKGFYGATELNNILRNDSLEGFSAPNYRELVDAPILFGEPDTAQFQVAGTEILIAVVNALPGHNYPYARFIRDDIQPQLEAMLGYLGDSLPVRHYSYLVYFEPVENDNMLGDALEHNRSSLYLYSGRGMGKIAGMLKNLSLHEFFHVLTPLHLHSEKIDQYNFINPEQSKHLWLYEGLTEYLAYHMPVKTGLMPLGDFLQNIESKCRDMQQYDAKLSLTDLSRNAMAHQDQYYNVYLRGALVNMCLDLRLVDLSEGKYNLQMLVRDLMKKYGPNQPFAEETLFDEITAMTFPEIRDFFSRYVENSEPLPLADYLLKAGMLYDARERTIKITANPVPAQWKFRKAWIGR